MSKAKEIIIPLETIIQDIRWRKLFNPLPKDKILEVTKLKAFADDKLNFA